MVGKHNGIHHWTIGQRARLPGHIKQLFIMRKMDQQNIILVSPGTDHTALHSDLLYTKTPYWIDGNPMATQNIFQCSFRFQHTKPLVDCNLVLTSGGIKQQSTDGLLVKLTEPLRAITPGQYAVFYDKGECLGAARIITPGPPLEYSNENDIYNEQETIEKKRCIII